MREDLERRAAAFAALSDPARLRIVDLLTVGDLAPKEIGAELDMSSNLVSFHLGVLEERGIITRRASEGDGRRNYVRLRSEAFRTLEADPIPVAGRVLFVCTANSARSQLAAGVWAQESDIPCASAGTHPGPAVNPRAVSAARRWSIPLVGEMVPRAFAEVRRAGDFVVTVCDRAHELLHGADQAHWSIPDPARADSDSAFDDVVREIRERVADMLPRLTPA
ncbi:metalloregulator ArsR/SmtB family transcription factor [Cnuibacter physcomitrellae]|uniref:metalloregulator ArsR/SmtB family transcription factor n=1 Tax=Cnuibacter physcomitrellae TaxID=1619308 RepID=UPI002175DA76|nr:metalloregulator ArsR/SmtB family transcription factor [Cnuibacter physcomitrellae]MCS5497995.1 metalloregulator ArsR/SmtB family transcription factor [Cnuibacter physcomitrellae]